MAGLSQEELADKSGLSVRAISNIERARTARPYATSIRLLADALGLAGQARADLMRARSAVSGTVADACADLRAPALRSARERPAAPGPAGASPPGAAPLGAAPPAPGSVVADWPGRPGRGPAQLPDAGPGLAGLDAELGALTDTLAGAGEAGTVMLAVIAGAAGTGKTALALHWSHAMASRFPDGQLFADLGGTGPADAAADPARVVRGFLAALGVPAARVPGGLADGAALYRSVLAGRRVLVLLENACDEQQVRPLLPGSAWCAAVVTSRRPLTGLIAIEGARSIIVPAVAGLRPADT